MACLLLRPGGGAVAPDAAVWCLKFWTLYAALQAPLDIGHEHQSFQWSVDTWTAMDTSFLLARRFLRRLKRNEAVIFQKKYDIETRI